MKLVRVVGAMGLVGLAAVNSPVAVAADSGWYGGVGVGQSRAKIDDERIAAGLRGQGLTVNSIDDDDRHFGFKLFAGWKLNRNFAVEGGYFNLGEFGFTANTTPAGSLNGSIKIQGLNLDAVGILPITEKFSALGRVGVTYTQSKDTFSGTGAAANAFSDANPKKSEGNYKLGLGVQYDFTEALGLRGEWERYRVNDAVGNKGDVDLLLIGLVYTFGGR